MQKIFIQIFLVVCFYRVYRYQLLSLMRYDLCICGFVFKRGVFYHVLFCVAMSNKFLEPV